jgi:hypothetical protein
MKCTCFEWETSQRYLDEYVDTEDWNFCPYCGNPLI